MKKRSILPKLLFVLSALFLNVMIAHNTFATNAVMKISPVATSVYIDAGKTQNYQFTIENTGKDETLFEILNIRLSPIKIKYSSLIPKISEETTFVFKFCAEEKC